jgi:hypothetical protein
MLTKSDLQSYLQCPRKLWLEHNNPAAAGPNDSSARRRQADGNDVGHRARAELQDPLWPAAVEDKAEAAIAALAILNEAPGMSAVEFPMVHGGLYARADALIWLEEGYVLSELVIDLANRGFGLSFVGSSLKFKGAPGKIKTTDPHFEVTNPRGYGVDFRIFVDIEFDTLGYHEVGVSDDSRRHELDIVVTTAAAGYPAHDDIALAGC